MLGAIAGSAVILPQSMGLGVVLFHVMGLDASAGALAGIMGAAILSFVSGLFGATIGMLSAPNGPVTMLLVGTFTALSAGGSSADSMVVTLSAILILTGLFQILFSLIGGTKLIKYIPYPIIVGQISAVGVLMIKSQASAIIAPFKTLDSMAMAAVPLAVALITIAAILLVKRFFKNLPAVLVGFAVGIAAYQAIDAAFVHHAYSAWVVGAIPSMEHMHFGFSMDNLKTLDIGLVVITALALMILASTDCLVTAIVADSQTNLKHDSKKEIYAQGIAHVGIGLLGGIGGGGTKGATLTNLQSGGRRWSAALSGIFFVLLVLFFGFLGEYLPIAVLAGVIAYVGFGMINFNLFNWIRYKKSRLDGLIALTVFVATVSVDLVSAVGIGIILSMIMHIRAQIKTPIIHAKSDGGHKHAMVFRTDEEKQVLQQEGAHIEMLELKGNLTFATSDQLLHYSEKYFKKDQFLILNFLRVQSIDITGVILILQIASRMKGAGGELILCHMHKDLGMGKKINKSLERIDKKNSMKIRIFIGAELALEYAENKILERNHLNYKKSDIFVPLKDNVLCKGFPEDAVKLLEASSTKIEVKKGSLLFGQVEDTNSLYMLLQGEIEIRLYKSKKDYKRLFKHSAGAYFGEVGFLNPGKRTASAVATEDSILLELKHKDIFDVKEKEDLAIRLLFTLSHGTVESMRYLTKEVRRLEKL